MLLYDTTKFFKSFFKGWCHVPIYNQVIKTNTGQLFVFGHKKAGIGPPQKRSAHSLIARLTSQATFLFALRFIRLAVCGGLAPAQGLM